MRNDGVERTQRLETNKGLRSASACASMSVRACGRERSGARLCVKSPLVWKCWWGNSRKPLLGLPVGHLISGGPIAHNAREAGRPSLAPPSVLSSLSAEAEESLLWGARACGVNHSARPCFVLLTTVLSQQDDSEGRRGEAGSSEHRNGPRRARTRTRPQFQALCRHDKVRTRARQRIESVPSSPLNLRFTTV